MYLVTRNINRDSAGLDTQLPYINGVQKMHNRTEISILLLTVPLCQSAVVTIDWNN